MPPFGGQQLQGIVFATGEPAPSGNRKELVRTAFARAAATYDAHVDVQHEVASGLATRLDRNEPTSILEIGCGTGNYTHELRQRFPGAQISAVDFCQEMLRLAESKFAHLPGIVWRLADGENIDDGPTSWDLITSSAALQWFDDLPTALERYGRMLSPGGQLAFALFGPETFRELREVLAEEFVDLDLPAAHFVGRDALASLLSSRFARVTIEEDLHQRHYDTLLALLRKIKLTGTGGRRWKGLLTPSRLRRLESRYRERFHGISCTHQVFYCLASRP